MRELSKEMQKFLVSTVFGYDMDEEDSDEAKLKETCAGRAYLDLARVIPYKFSTRDVQKNKNEDIVKFKESKDKFKEDVKNILFNETADNPGEMIKKVKDHADKKGYKDSVFKTEDGFTYGMAQKWVNMYNKYMWLFSAEGYNNREFDMPIDSYIIDALYYKGVLSYKKRDENKIETLFKGWSGIVGEDKRPSDYIKRWSKWKEEEYKAVQTLIRKNLPERKTILSWENEMWMEQAKKLREM